jgi:hypothetical protein
MSSDNYRFIGGPHDGETRAVQHRDDGLPPTTVVTLVVTGKPSLAKVDASDKVRRPNMQGCRYTYNPTTMAYHWTE